MNWDNQLIRFGLLASAGWNADVTLGGETGGGTVIGLLITLFLLWLTTRFPRTETRVSASDLQAALDATGWRMVRIDPGADGTEEAR